MSLRTDEIRGQMKNRDQLHRIFLKTRNQADWSSYKNARDSVKASLMSAQRKYVHCQVEKHKDNSASLWKIINANVSLRQRKSLTYAKNPYVMAEEFNQHFSTVGKKAAEATSKLLLHKDITTITLPQFTTNGTVTDEAGRFEFSPVT